MQESYETERQVRWGIVRRADGRLLGTCGFVWLRPHSAEIGYDLARACWGKGYMYEALSALLDYAFFDLDLNRIEALVMPANMRSKRLLKRLGFAHEGTLREYDYFKDAFHDMEMHALLRRDWREETDAPS
jgi:ribosomal-protein-alanine N-acetyltransferase